MQDQQADNDRTDTDVKSQEKMPEVAFGVGAIVVINGAACNIKYYLETAGGHRDKMSDGFAFCQYKVRTTSGVGVEGDKIHPMVSAVSGSSPTRGGPFVISEATSKNLAFYYVSGTASNLKIEQI